MHKFIGTFNRVNLSVLLCCDTLGYFESGPNVLSLGLVSHSFSPLKHSSTSSLGPTFCPSDSLATRFLSIWSLYSIGSLYSIWLFDTHWFFALRHGSSACFRLVVWLIFRLLLGSKCNVFVVMCVL